MTIGVIGCGRWGTLIAWYLHSLGHKVAVYGRASSPRMQRLLRDRTTDLLTLPDDIVLTTDLGEVTKAETLIISISSQSLRSVAEQLRELSLQNRNIVLCMKGIEMGTGLRLSQIVTSIVHPSNSLAVWLGPGHVQDFYAGIPNCMVIDSNDETVKKELIQAFSGPLIRFYYGTDLIGNEIGGAAKNVIGIAAGILDGLELSTLKGALMSRGTREIGRLIAALGGNEQSAYGLCHLGDYQATLFSPYSHNRQYGESVVTGTPFEKLAEGYYTVRGLCELAEKHGVELPICEAVQAVLYENADPREAIMGLFDRRQKEE
jgi:glycerol-3-phosphate dehydrogenase (NAD(P)+)